MTQDDYARITLRLPPDLHRRIDESARVRKRSLNSEIIDLLESGLLADWEMRLASLPEEDWMHEIRQMHAASRKRYEMLERGLMRMRIEEDAARKKKGAA